MPSFMVIEDDLSIRYMLKETLTAGGHEVIAAVESVKSALNFLKRGQVPDVVVLDLILPGATGGTIIDYLRENHKDTKILVVTGLSEEQVLLALPKDGYDGLITKPFDIPYFRAKVAALLKKP